MRTYQFDIKKIIRNFRAIIVIIITMFSCAENLEKQSTSKEKLSFDVDTDIGLHIATRGITNNINELKNSGFNLAMVDHATQQHKIPVSFGHVSYLNSRWMRDVYLWSQTDINKYDFYAFYPQPTEDDRFIAQFDINDQAEDLISYKMLQNPKDHIDILLAEAKDIAWTSAPIRLMFRHITSALKFSEMKTANEDGIVIDIEKIVIHGLNTHANYSIVTNSWTPVEGALSTPIHFLKGEALLQHPQTGEGKVAITSPDGIMFFPPQIADDLADLSILISIKITVPQISGEEDFVQFSTVEITGDKLITDRDGIETGKTVSSLISEIRAGEILDMVLTYSTTTASFTIRGTITTWNRKPIILPDYE